MLPLCNGCGEEKWLVGGGGPGTPPWPNSQTVLGIDGCTRETLGLSIATGLIGWVIQAVVDRVHVGRRLPLARRASQVAYQSAGIIQQSLFAD